LAITIKLLGALRHFSDKKELSLAFQQGFKVKDAVAALSLQAPQLEHTFCDSQLNDAHSNSLILVNGIEISVLAGYETVLRDGDELVFVPVVHGG
jgi:molybdopterin converting factor small subunit